MLPWPESTLMLSIALRVRLATAAQESSCMFSSVRMLACVCARGARLQKRRRSSAAQARRAHRLRAVGQASCAPKRLRVKGRCSRVGAGLFLVLPKIAPPTEPTKRAQPQDPRLFVLAGLHHCCALNQRVLYECHAFIPGDNHAMVIVSPAKKAAQGKDRNQGLAA
ncbi:uncharacterized protein PSANT_02494 [Moesziomyces antarcticus]|uniref:Uncharacterized protein n=1 Tax=Pseudozyma antarctica TaxID=84753 RepID=A0A5C3FKC1_PSEA2|nr:uncharacterized protein PSANT_02494 [Moesziomyces antarcticus]